MMALSAPTLECDQIRDLLPAYALDALEVDERAAVEHHLVRCAPCRMTLTSMERVVTALAVAPAPAHPPAALRARLLAETHGRPGGTSVSPRDSAGPRSAARVVVPRWAAIALATAAIALLTLVGVLMALLAQAQSDRDTALAAQRELAAYLSTGGRITALTPLSASRYGSTQGRGSLVTAPGLPPLIVVDQCPPSNADRRYRVWLGRGEERTPVGELTVGRDGAGWLRVAELEPIESFEIVGVTMVSAGGEWRDLFVGHFPNADSATTR